jgi:hypothetical protein
LHLAGFFNNLADEDFAEAADGGDDEWGDGLGKRLVGDLGLGGGI